MIGHIGGVVAISIVAVTVVERDAQYPKLMTVIFLLWAAAEAIVPGALALAGLA